MNKQNREDYYFEPVSQRQEISWEEVGEMSVQKNTKKYFVSGVAVGMAAALLILAMVFWGVRLVQMREKPTQTQAKVVELSEDSAISPEVVSKLQRLEAVIDRYFSLGEVENDEIQEELYRGMLYALGDPYSEYYSAEELEEFLNHAAGVFYGIGAYIAMDEKMSLPKLTGVTVGGPAEAAQLRANDIIYEVDGKPVYGMPLAEVVDLIKGEEGTQVLLTIYREGESDFLKVPILRAAVESSTVHFKMLDDRIAYIRIVEFDDVTVDQFAEALAMARGSGMEGLLLDLRTNPGGRVATVLEICRMLLPEGVIVYTEDKYGQRVEYTCDGSRELKEPLVVLVDMNSASASEIMAGAIQDYGIGTLVGTTTFGKGVVQQVFGFEDGSAVKLTISSYFTPKGRDINEIGITPDVICEFDANAYYDPENPRDNQLEKAKEVLSNLLEQ